MALTWTRFVPEHYDVAPKSPASLPDEVGSQAFPFMHLTVDLRLQVYRAYLLDQYTPSPTQIHEMVLDPLSWNKPPVELLQLSKTVNAEIQDLLQHESTFNLRICWQDAGFDGLAMSCFKAKGMRPDFDHIGHLRIEIYPPHEDRPIDMVYIWRHVQKLCYDLGGASCIRRLSLHFMENEYSAWSFEGIAEVTMDISSNTDPLPSDIISVLELFKLLKNVKNAQIHLPAGLSEDMSLQKVRQEIEHAMMKIELLDDKHQKSVIKTLEETIAKNEETLKYCTGIFAQDKLDRLCGDGYWVSAPHLDIFEKVWPHRDCVFEWDYKQRSQYIGDNFFKNLHLDYVDVDPYDNSDYCYG